jgi:hypothetical protein
MIRRVERKTRNRPKGLRREDPVKTVISLLIAACLMSGCVAGSAISHEDSPAAVKRDEGPALCRDGTTPPCVTRD